MADLINVLAAGVVDAEGETLDAGIVYVYKKGTTNKATIYSDESLTTSVSNPITLDSAGKAEVYVNEDVRVLIQDSSAVEVQDIESIGEVDSLRGDVSLGTSSSDALSINARVDTDIIPSATANHDLGSTALRWADIFMEGDLYLKGSAGTGGKLTVNSAGDSLVMEDFETLEAVNGGKNIVHGWCRFTGMGTIAIVDSYNVDSITDNSTGRFTVTWDVPFADANYCAFANSNSDATGVAPISSASSVDIACGDATGTPQDPTEAYVMAVGAR